MSDQAGGNVAEYTKLDVLDALLDTQKLAGDLFDAVEVEHLVIDRALLMRLANLVHRLAAMHQGLRAEYILSNRIGEDFMADLRASVQREVRPL